MNDTELSVARNVMMIIELKIAYALEALDFGKFELIRLELVEIEERIQQFREQYPGPGK